jgi:hypothetical protein
MTDDSYKREAKLVTQSVGALVVARRFEDGAVMPVKVFADMADVVEYARYYYRTEDVVVVDSWGGVVAVPVIYSVFLNHDRPVAVAKAEHQETPEGARRPYVNLKHQELRIYPTEIATFADLEAPTWNVERVKPGYYLGSCEGHRGRFLITKETQWKGPATWTVADTKKGRTYTYQRTLDEAKRKVTDILRREHAAVAVALRCTPFPG